MTCGGCFCLLAVIGGININFEKSYNESNFNVYPKKKKISEFGLILIHNHKVLISEFSTNSIDKKIYIRIRDFGSNLVYINNKFIDVFT